MLRDILNIRETITAAFKPAINSLKTEIKDRVRAFSTTATVLMAERRGVTNYYYLGPLDEKNRPFCRQLLGMRNEPVYSRPEIENMNNDMGLDVMTYSGGFNCRHRWTPVDKLNLDQL